MKTRFLLAFTFTISLTVLFAQLPPYVSTTNLMAWYPFTNNTNDSSGGNRNLLNSGVTFAQDRFGSDNQSASFNGTSNYLNVQNFPGMAAGSISVWVKPNTAGTGNDCIVQLGKYTSSSNKSVVYLANNHSIDSFWAITYLNGSGTDTRIQASAPATSQWTHLVVNWYESLSGSTEHYILIYKNGVFAESKFIGYPPTPYFTGSGDLTVGAAYSNGALSQYFDGEIDDIAVYKARRIECEANELYRSCVLSPLQSKTQNVGGTATFTVPINCWADTGIAYKWQVNNGIGGFQDVNNAGQFSGANTNTLSVANLTSNNNNWSFQCILTYGCGNKTTSSASLTVTQPSSVEDIAAASAFSIHPNPAQSMITLSVSDKLTNQPYRILNAIGQQVMEGNIADTNTSIDISSLTNGVYMVQVSGKYTKRLIVGK